MKRRIFVKQLALSAAIAAIGFGSTSILAQQKTVKVGVLHSLSGTMAISETVLKDTVLMAIEEINAKGGVMGMKIEPVVVDPASNWPLFAEKARQLITQDKVAVTFGCWTSVSRKSVLPVFEELNGLLFYPLEYEGEEASYNIFYGSSVPDNKAIPAVDTTALLGDAASLRHILLGYCEKVIALEATVADLAPRADALNRLTVSDGSLNITDAAKSLQINPKAFFTYLRHESWIYTRAGSADNIAYQDKIRAGYLEHKLTTIIKADGSERTVTQARVTPRGLARLALDFERHAKGGNQDMLI